MEDIIKDWQRNATKNEDRNFRFLTNLKHKRNQKRIDATAKDLHNEAFEKIDCLQCGNCCKTSSPLIDANDLKRISKVLNMSEEAFTKQYLEIDNWGELKMKALPCPFFGSDNACTIYEHRPKDCVGFPHTDKPQFTSRRYMHTNNTIDCPAVFYIVEQLRKIL